MLTLMMEIIILKDVINLFIYLLPWYFFSSQMQSHKQAAFLFLDK